MSGQVFLYSLCGLAVVGLVAYGVYEYRQKHKPTPTPAPVPGPAPVPKPTPTPSTKSMAQGKITGPVMVSAPFGGSAPASAGNQVPQAYYPYALNQAAAFDSNFANELKGDAAVPSQPLTDVNNLLPASWRPGNTSATAAADSACAMSDSLPAVPGSNWTKYAPTRAAFEQAVVAGASMRTAMNDRSPLTKNVGMSDFYQVSRRIAPPLEAAEVIFNDASFRQDLIHQQTGRYPTSTAC